MIEHNLNEFRRESARQCDVVRSRCAGPDQANHEPAQRVRGRLSAALGLHRHDGPGDHRGRVTETPRRLDAPRRVLSVAHGTPPPRKDV